MLLTIIEPEFGLRFNQINQLVLHKFTIQYVKNSSKLRKNIRSNSGF